jgi:hypothetical protein
MTSVNVSEGVNEVIGRMVPSFNATSGAAVGPYRESRFIRHARRTTDKNLNVRHEFVQGRTAHLGLLLWLSATFLGL